MKGRSTVSFKWLCIIFLFTGCAVRSVYIPVSQNTPQFADKKALQATAYIGTNHFEAQLAHNPFKNIAFCANLNYGSGISIYDAAAGVYGHSAENSWRYETFVGYGYNTNFAFQIANYNTLLHQPIKNYEIRSIYNKFYLQPTLGYHGQIKMYKMEYSFSIGARLSALYFKTYSYSEIDDAATKQSGQTVYLENINYNNKFLYLLEPCYTNKFGTRGFYGILQFQAIVPYSDQIDVRNTTFSQVFIFSLGLQYNINFRSAENVTKD